MWIELIKRLEEDAPFGQGCKFPPPADLAAIKQAEEKLSVEFPDDLRDLLLESDGVWAPNGGLIWSVNRIVKDNTTFRTYPDFRELYMPFDHLLFFGDNCMGDQYAFRILAGKVDCWNVYEWLHEDDSRQWFARDLRDYLARAQGYESYVG